MPAVAYERWRLAPCGFQIADGALTSKHQVSSGVHTFGDVNATATLNRGEACGGWFPAHVVDPSSRAA